jgi:hypothetical protein
MCLCVHEPDFPASRHHKPWGGRDATHLKKTGNISKHLQLVSLISNYLLIFFPVPGFEVRTLCLVNRCSTTWATLPVLFSFSYFSDRVSCFCLELASDSDPPNFASHTAGITCVSHYAQLVCWTGVSLTFSEAGLEHWSFQSLPPKRLNLHLWTTVLFYLFNFEKQSSKSKQGAVSWILFWVKSPWICIGVSAHFVLL